MSVDKALHKIQLQIDELAPALEMFIEHTVQPTVGDCESLQKRLNELQDNIAIYKYLRANTELSPSFNIHSKISEKEMPVEPVGEKKPEFKETASVEEIKATIKEPLQETSRMEAEVSRKSIQIAINDKFRFINELFSQNPSEYAIAMEQLNNLKSWHDSEFYLNSLKVLYHWKENSDVVKQLYSLVQKRFD